MIDTVDFSIIISQLFSILWLLIPVMILAGIVKSPWFKGVMGEGVVNFSAQLLLDKEKYHLIKDVTLEIDTGTTQIDHIIVSVHGIFVVETKNMTGWIFGSAHNKMWTQKIYQHSSKFQNPLHQNYKHVKALESLLGVAEDKLFSLVVFIGDSTFKTQMPENVTSGGGYIRFIKSKTERLFSEAEVSKIISQIETGRLPSSIRTNLHHVDNLKTKNSVESQVCPKCGSRMVIRVTKKGVNSGKQFWGCSRYPKCKGTRNYSSGDFI